MEVDSKAEGQNQRNVQWFPRQVEVVVIHIAGNMDIEVTKNVNQGEEINNEIDWGQDWALGDVSNDRSRIEVE